MIELQLTELEFQLIANVLNKVDPTGIFIPQDLVTKLNKAFQSFKNLSPKIEEWPKNEK